MGRLSMRFITRWSSATAATGTIRLFYVGVAMIMSGTSCVSSTTMVLSGLVDAETRYREVDNNGDDDNHTIIKRIHNLDVVTTVANETTTTTAYCRLVTMGPFSLFEHAAEWDDDDEEHHDELHNRIASPSGDALRHLAAVALALSHLNTGDGTVIPEVAGLPQRCNIQFTSEFIDTANRQSQAAESVLSLLDRTKDLPCGFVGDLSSTVTSIVATLTTLRGYPQISPLAKDPTLSSHDTEQQFRYLARLSPSLYDGEGSGYRPDPLLQYLHDEYNVRRLIVAYKEDQFTNACTHALVRNVDKFFPTMTITTIAISPQMEPQQITMLMRSIQAASFRYVYALFTGDEYEQVFAAAVQHGLAGLKSNYTWIWSDVNVETYLDQALQDNNTESTEQPSSSSSTIQAMFGSLLCSRIGSAPGFGRYDAFVKEWERLGQSDDDLEYLQSKIPRFPMNLRYRPVLNQTVVFATDSPSFPYTTLYYDAVIAMGLAACSSQSNSINNNNSISNNNNISSSNNNTSSTKNVSSSSSSLPTGPEHFAALIRTAFVGASGQILFDPQYRTRAENTSSYRLWNFAPKRAANQTVVLRKVELAAYESGIWTKANGSPYTFFANGATVVPFDLPIAHENKNYIGGKLRLIGYSLATIVVFLSFAFSKWTLVSHNERIVKASQPIFLHLICTGTGLMGLSIAVMGLDDETIGNMDAVCSSAPALLWLGWCFAFSAILSKTLRINMIFHNPRFRRIRVTSGDVMRPMCLMLCANVVVFVAREVFDPLLWTRTVIRWDEYGRATESVGVCARKTPIFFIAVVTINAGVVALASYQSYVARKISTEFSESEYIAKAVAMVLVVSCMALPLYFVSEDSTKSRFVAKASSVFVVSMSLLLLIFVPKMFYSGEGVRAGIRKSIVKDMCTDAVTKLTSDRSVDASHMSSQPSDNTQGDDTQDGVMIVDHPKINSQLADRLHASRKEVNLLKRMIRELRQELAASRPRAEEPDRYDIVVDHVHDDNGDTKDGEHSTSLGSHWLDEYDEVENDENGDDDTAAAAVAAAVAADISMQSSGLHLLVPTERKTLSSSLSSLSHAAEEQQQQQHQRLDRSFKILQQFAVSPKMFAAATVSRLNQSKRKTSLPVLSKTLSWHSFQRQPSFVVSKDLFMTTTTTISPTEAKPAAAVTNLAASAPSGLQLPVVDDYDHDDDDNNNDNDAVDGSLSSSSAVTSSAAVSLSPSIRRWQSDQGTGFAVVKTTVS